MDPIIWVPGAVVLSVVIIVVLIMGVRRGRR